MTLANSTFIVTGANTGIGRATVEGLAARGVGRLIVVARNAEKTEPVLQALKTRWPAVDVRFLKADMASLASVQAAANELLGWGLPLDVLVNNAGIAALRGLTTDGFELAFGTNHLGPFLFTEWLLPTLLKSAAPRVVNVASRSHYSAKSIDWGVLRQSTRSTSGLDEYAVSKVCNVLYAKELSRRFAATPLFTASLHPGVVASDIWQRRLGVFSKLITPFMMTAEDGAKTQLTCATSPDLNISGLYYDRERPVTPSRLSQDLALQDELVRRSREWCSKWLPNP